MEDKVAKIGVVILRHPETLEEQEFSKEHARKILELQAVKNLPEHQCWKPADNKASSDLNQLGKLAEPKTETDVRTDSKSSKRNNK